MNRDELQINDQRIVEAVTCSTCSAKKGGPCITVVGIPMRTVHRARAQYASRIRGNHASESLRSRLMTGM